MTTRVLSTATVRSPTALSNGQRVAPVPGAFLDIDDFLANQLCLSGWVRVGTVGTTAERPSASPLVGAGMAQQGDLHIDKSLSLSVIFDGASWRDPATGAIV
jgi:hypothetical protein